MSEPPKRETPPDPFALWRQTYELAEEAWSKALGQVSGTDAFSASLGKSLDSYLGFQKLMRDNMQLYLESMNVPTRDDIARLGELIVNLENKIDDLDDRVDSLLEEVAGLRRGAGARPSETATDRPASRRGGRSKRREA
jgi:polyhydroxyalkanoic acid synthase PhaR subunit